MVVVVVGEGGCSGVDTNYIASEVLVFIQYLKHKVQIIIYK